MLLCVTLKQAKLMRPKPIIGKNIVAVHKSNTVFRQNEKGELYHVELSKEKAWYIGPAENEFSHLASEYITSADTLIQLNKNIGESFGAVPIYLALHGLELKLKGAIHSFDPTTYTVMNIKNKYGHKIIKLLKEYHKHFPSLLDQFDTEQQKNITSIFKDYEDKGYEYLSKNVNQGTKSLTVNFELIEDVVFTMINTINLHLNQHFNKT